MQGRTIEWEPNFGLRDRNRAGWGRMTGRRTFGGGQDGRMDRMNPLTPTPHPPLGSSRDQPDVPPATWNWPRWVPGSRDQTDVPYATCHWQATWLAPLPEPVEDHLAHPVILSAPRDQPDVPPATWNWPRWVPGSSDQTDVPYATCHWQATSSTPLPEPVEGHPFSSCHPVRPSPEIHLPFFPSGPSPPAIGTRQAPWLATSLDP